MEQDLERRTGSGRKTIKMPSFLFDNPLVEFWRIFFLIKHLAIDLLGLTGRTPTHWEQQKQLRLIGKDRTKSKAKQRQRSC
jgi:hypothetical protein